MTLIIGLIGYKNSGKTSLAKRFGDTFFPGDYEIIGFSNPLYRMLEAGFGITIEEIQDKPRRNLSDPRLGGKSIQHALNTLGTKWGREMIYDRVWVDRSLDSIGNKAVYIADNVRYPNEYDGIESVGGHNVALINPLVSDDGTWPEAHILELQQRARLKIDNDPRRIDLMGCAITLKNLF